MGELTAERKKETLKKYYEKYYQTYFTKYGKYIDYYIHKYFPKGNERIKDLSLKSYQSRGRTVDESMKKLEEVSFRNLFQAGPKGGLSARKLQENSAGKSASKTRVSQELSFPGIRPGSMSIPKNAETIRLSKSREFMRFIYDMIYRRMVIYELRDMIYKHIPDESHMQTCLKNPANAAHMEYLGSGEYGKIFKIDETRCVKFIAISEQLNNLRYIDYRNEIEISKVAGDHGISPKIYDSYVCVNNKDSSCYGVIYMEYIKGLTLSDFLYKYYSKENVLIIRRLLEEKINKLHNLGILHSDLHSDNVMVVMDGSNIKDVVIIDFGFSQYIKDYIYHRNHQKLNDTIFHFSREYVYGELSQMIVKKLNL